MTCGPADVLEYASNDVAHLFELKKAVMDKIIDNKLLDEYILMNLTVRFRLIMSKYYFPRCEPRWMRD